MHTFTIKIGDPYKDGHGRHDSFLVKSSKPIEEVQRHMIDRRRSSRHA